MNDQAPHFDPETIARFKQECAEERAEAEMMKALVRRMRDGVASHNEVLARNLRGGTLDLHYAFLKIVDAAIMYGRVCSHDGADSNSHRRVARTRVRDALREWRDLQK